MSAYARSSIAAGPTLILHGTDGAVSIAAEPLPGATPVVTA